MQIFNLIISIVGLTFIGFNILCLFPENSRKFFLWEAIAISFGLGIAALTIEMLLFYFLQFDFNVTGLLLAWLILLGVNILRISRGRELPVIETLPGPVKAYGMLDIFLIAGISFEIFHAFFRALVRPIEAYDAVAIYAIKSKIFYLANSIPQEYFAYLARLFPHPDYP
ncbi:MAG: hypothetical protein NC933_05290, partial [Candidatus Omnitrophica bacterium]|nr:hypothetical protein [Candidatus Omnitrophota bacterium]